MKTQNKQSSLSDKQLYNENEGWQYFHYSQKDVRDAVKELKRPFLHELSLIMKNNNLGNRRSMEIENILNKIDEIFGEKLTQ